MRPYTVREELRAIERRIERQENSGKGLMNFSTLFYGGTLPANNPSYGDHLQAAQLNSGRCQLLWDELQKLLPV